MPVFASDYRAGIGASLLAGLRAVRPIEREIVMFLGDMPLAAMPRAARLTAGYDAVRPTYRGLPGHPLLVRTDAARRLAQAGDRGLAAALDPARVVRVRGGPGTILDLDDRTALRRVRWTRPR